MKKRWKITATNAIYPASGQGKGIPGKGGATTNYDPSKADGVIKAEIRRNMNNRKKG